MSKENERKEDCPLSRLCSKLDRSLGRDSAFRRHLNRSRSEFLKAVRSVIDKRIDELEGQEKSKERGDRKSSIEVE